MVWRKRAEFARPLGAKDKKPRKRKDGVVSDARTIADRGLYGAGAGFVIPGLLPIRSRRTDKALRSRHMKKIPVVGNRVRRMAIDTQRATPLSTRRAGQYLAANLPAQTAGGLALGTAGLLYGANKVRQRRRRERLARR